MKTLNELISNLEAFKAQNPQAAEVLDTHLKMAKRFNVTNVQYSQPEIEWLCNNWWTTLVPFYNEDTNEIKPELEVFASTLVELAAERCASNASKITLLNDRHNHRVPHDMLSGQAKKSIRTLLHNKAPISFEMLESLTGYSNIWVSAEPWLKETKLIPASIPNGNGAVKWVDATEMAKFIVFERCDGGYEVLLGKDNNGEKIVNGVLEDYV